MMPVQFQVQERPSPSISSKLWRKSVDVLLELRLLKTLSQPVPVRCRAQWFARWYCRIHGWRRDVAERAFCQAIFLSRTFH